MKVGDGVEMMSVGLSNYAPGSSIVPLLVVECPQWWMVLKTLCQACAFSYRVG